jgi:SAM-dependent methyltransferase
MNTTENKNHWYDGLLYDLLVAPHQDRAFASVRGLITDGSTVIDVGCGTGRLAFQLADACKSIDGVDPSMRNIAVARRRLRETSTDRVRFHHIDALGFLAEARDRFDYATVSYVLHEIGEGERALFLNALSAAAHRVILVDYLVPRQADIRKVFNDVVEFAAGADHYRNFRSFLAQGGLTGLVEKTGLHVLRELRHQPPSTHVVLAARSEFAEG